MLILAIRLAVLVFVWGVWKVWSESVWYILSLLYYLIRTLFFMNHNTTEVELKTAFQRYGDVKECSLITDKNTGASRCFGFVTFNRFWVNLE